MTGSSVARHAAGQWDRILPALGIPHEALTKKHKPCPGCGGRDRFRYVGGERGEWFCGQGGVPTGGDGFNLLMHVHGWPFKEAARQVEQVLGISSTRDHQAFIPKLTQAEKDYMRSFCLIFDADTRKGAAPTTEELDQYTAFSKALAVNEANNG